MSQGEFFQNGPELENQFQADRLLQSYLRRILPPEIYSDIEPDLQRLGDRVVSDILAMGEDANANEPKLISYDPWGRRIDEIQTTRGWQQLDRVSAEEGMVAIGYERRQGVYSRLYQFANLYLSPGHDGWCCPPH
jgi:putative acyl-CoA dehydrogenase